MRKLVSLLLLAAVASPVFAGPVLNVPEPEALSLLGIGAIALFVSRRVKK